MNFLIGSERLRGVAEEIFRAAGLCADDAAQVADLLVDADLRGVRSHGVIRLKQYVEKILAGGSDPKAAMEVVRESPVSAVLDAKGGLGALAGERAVALAREKAAASGIGMVTVIHSNHFGMAGHWSLKLAGEDMIGFSCSNTFPSMPAPGAMKSCLGNNPFSVAFHTGKYPEVCVDMACSVAAYGKMKDMTQRGETIPSGWMYDKDGNYTQDLSRYAMMVPFAGHKGYGIAFAVELMTALLAGGSLAFETHRQSIPELPELASHCFCAVNISAFRDLEEFREDAQQYIDYIKSLPMREGAGSALYPGEIEYGNKCRNLESGVVLSGVLAEEICALAHGLGIPPAQYEILMAYPLAEQ